MHTRRCILVVAFAALACTSTPRAPEPGTSAIFGSVSLDPREGVEPAHMGGSYGDRRMEHSELVDYSRPGFAVVYLDSSAATGASARLSIRDSQVATRIEPAYAVVSSGSQFVVTNASQTPRTLSCPTAALVKRLEPGESATVDVAAPGEYRVYLLDVPGAASTVFAASGAFTVAAETGRFEIRDLAPGRYQLRTWHPRFPPTSRWVDLQPGALLRVDIELGVEHGEESNDGAR